MTICPAVCTTTYEMVVNLPIVGLILLIVLVGVLMYLKKLKLVPGVILVIVFLISITLVGFKINTCDSGCKTNGQIYFENELFGDKD